MWVQSISYPGYEVREDGKIRNINTKREIATHLDKYGYQAVAIYRNGKQRKPKVHRLIAEVFVPNPNGYSQINHKDEDKTNNRAENLEWCTPAYNSQYGTRTERSAANHRRRVVACKDDERIEFESIKEAALWLGCTTSSVGRALESQSAHCKGYSFSYMA